MTPKRLTIGLAVVGVLVALWLTLGYAHMRAMRRAWYWNIGTNIVKTTNAPNLAPLGPGLNARLEEFLSAPAAVKSVVPGDAPAPIGDGTAAAQIVLTNSRGERLAMRLRFDETTRQEHVIGFWTPPEP